jgi:hypothetical protein
MGAYNEDVVHDLIIIEIVLCLGCVWLDEVNLCSPFICGWLLHFLLGKTVKATILKMICNLVGHYWGFACDDWSMIRYPASSHVVKNPLQSAVSWSWAPTIHPPMTEPAGGDQCAELTIGGAPTRAWIKATGLPINKADDMPNSGLGTPNLSLRVEP